MNKMLRIIYKPLAISLVLALMQLTAQLALAGPNPLQGGGARLITRGNQSIVVNGNRASTGMTLLTGAVIETPDNVGATVDLGALGRMDIAPNTRVTLEYDRETKTIKATLAYGCIILIGGKDTRTSVVTSQGEATRKDRGAAGAPLDVCFPPGAPAPIVNSGAAINAGATAAGSEGLNRGVLWALIGGAVAGVIIVALLSGDDNNPSPARP